MEPGKIKILKIKDLEEMYNKLVEGTETPKVVWIYCETCNRIYSMSLKSGTLCGHLKTIFNA